MKEEIECKFCGNIFYRAIKSRQNKSYKSSYKLAHCNRVFCCKECRNKYNKIYRIAYSAGYLAGTKK